MVNKYSFYIRLKKLIDYSSRSDLQKKNKSPWIVIVFECTFVACGPPVDYDLLLRVGCPQWSRLIGEEASKQQVLRPGVVHGGVVTFLFPGE